MTAVKIFQFCLTRLSNILKEEREAMVYILLEDVYGISKMDIALDKEIKPIDEKTLLQKLNRINTNEPIQHVIGFTYFRNRKFLVSADVLIPRPETEELIDIITENSSLLTAKILDIGTGSGCIPISLYFENNKAQITAIDISTSALEVAKKNAEQLNAKVNFIQNDFRNNANDLDTHFDIIVSNPPYISLKEKQSMHSNVLNYEPHLALFVDNENPLVFYEAIANFGHTHLNQKGIIAVEINEHLGEMTANVFKNEGYKEVTLIKDFYDKDRFILVKK